MSLTEYLGLLRRSWLLVASLALLGAVLGYGYASLQAPSYRAQTSTLVTTDVGGNASELLQGSTYAENLVASYVRLVTSERVLRPVVEAEDLAETPRQLANRVTAEAPLNTLLIDISVTDGDPDRAVRIADRITESLADTVREVSPVVDNEPSIRLTTVETAATPRFPFAPNKRLLTAAGLAAGLLLGVGVALVRHLRGSAVRTASEVARFTEVPVIGEVVEAKRDTRLSAAVIEQPMGPEAESLRALVANLGFVAVDEGLKSITVTSASPAESKSSVASALALVLTETSHKVLLIDADLRAPTLHTVTNLDNSLGLSTVLIGEDSVETAVQPWGRHGSLDVLTSGPLPPNAGQLLRSESMKALLKHAEDAYDYVVVDTPPVGSVVDAVWVGHLTTGALLVARRGRTKPRAMVRALESMASANVPVMGIVLSRMPRPSRARYGYGYVAPTPSGAGFLRRRRGRAG